MFFNVNTSPPARWRFRAQPISFLVDAGVPTYMLSYFTRDRVRGPKLPLEFVVHKLTQDSAQVYGLDDRGVIAPGYKADIVFLDLRGINWVPFNDPTNQMVHTEDGSSVRHVMVGGRMVVEDRVPVNVDMSSLAKKVEAARARLARVNKPGKILFDRLERIVGSFCPGLALTPHHIHRYGANLQA